MRARSGLATPCMSMQNLAVVVVVVVQGHENSWAIGDVGQKVRVTYHNVWQYFGLIPALESLLLHNHYQKKSYGSTERCKPNS